MADFGTVLNPLNKTKDLYCRSINVSDNFYINGVPIADSSGNPNALVNADLIADIVPSSICIFTGDDKYTCVSSDALLIDGSENIVIRQNVYADNITKLQNDVNDLKEVIRNLTGIIINN